MKRWFIGSVALVVVGSGVAMAQFPNRGSPPSAPVLRPSPAPQLSPYLNLLRGGDPAANYYLGVVPEQQRRSQTRQLGAAIDQILPQLSSVEQQLDPDYQPQIGAPSTAAGFGFGAPPRRFGTGLPGFGGPLPMPPAPVVPMKPIDRLP